MQCFLHWFTHKLIIMLVCHTLFFFSKPLFPHFINLSVCITCSVMKCMLRTVKFPFAVRTRDARIDHHQCGACSRLPQLSVDRLMRGDLYSKVSFRTAAAGCYTCYRGDRLMRTISVQTDWESVGTVVTWLLCWGDRPTQVTVKGDSTVFGYCNISLYHVTIESHNYALR